MKKDNPKKKEKPKPKGKISPFEKAIKKIIKSPPLKKG